MATKIKKPLIVALIGLGGVLCAASTVQANSDKLMQDKLLRQREVIQYGEHAGHVTEPSKGPDFRGVYYGYFPCKEEDCSGIKMTLSLKRSNNYLLVIQPAKASSREFYEKGKFTWNDETKIVALEPKDKSPGKRYRIVDEATLIQLNEDGSAMPGDQDDFTLKRGDTAKNREMHIH